MAPASVERCYFFLARKPASVIRVRCSCSVSATQSPIHTPYVEMLVKITQASYYFYTEGPTFRDGMLTVSDKPGLGYEIDRSKIESERELVFGP